MSKPESFYPTGARWWVWQPDKGDDLPEETASQAYIKKFGAPPEYVLKQVETGNLWLGPRPEQTA